MSHSSMSNLPDPSRPDITARLVGVLRDPIAIAVLASVGVHGLLWAGLPLLSNNAVETDKQLKVQVVELSPAERSRLPQTAAPSVPLTSPNPLPYPSSAPLPGSSPYNFSQDEPSDLPASDYLDRLTRSSRSGTQSNSPAAPETRPSTELQRQPTYNNDDYGGTSEGSTRRRSTAPQTPATSNSETQPGSTGTTRSNSNPSNQTPQNQTPQNQTPQNQTGANGLRQPSPQQLAANLNRQAQAQIYALNGSNMSRGDYSRNFETFTQFVEQQTGGNFKDVGKENVAQNLYPQAACPYIRSESKAEIGAWVKPDGQLGEKPRVLKSSGYEALDKLAQEYVVGQKFEVSESGKHKVKFYIFTFDPKPVCSGSA